MEYKKSGKYDPSKPFDFHKECNYCMKGSDWEREASLTIFRNGKISVDQNVGIRIKGQSTRDKPQKSFKVYARKKYGKKKIKSATLFPNNKDINGNPITEYDSICIRAVSDDDRDRDLFINTIMYGQILQGYLEMQESFLFINGEFWGMYVITEKYSEDYFSLHYNLPDDDIVYTSNDASEDSPQEVIDIFNFMDSYSLKDLSDEQNYEEVSKVVDIDSIIAHYSIGIYFAVYDWPNNNYGLWKYKGNKIDGNLYSDGKWRFMNYDYDFTMGHSQGGPKGFKNLRASDSKGYEYDMFNHVDQRGQRHPTNLFIALLKNEEFKNKFINYYIDFVNNKVPMSKIEPINTKFFKVTSILIGYSISRWKGYLGDSKEDYLIEAILNYKEKTLQEIRTFLEERPKYTIQNMKNYFKIE